MGHVNTIFHQILSFIPRGQFNWLVEKFDADRYVKTFNAWAHLVAMLFAQSTGKESLRDIVAAFNSQAAKLYHLGVKPICKSTLADANSRRQWEIFQDIYLKLLNRFQHLRPGHPFKFKNPLFSIDSSVIDLCLSVFPWAKFRTRKGAVKIHCLIDHRGLLPEMIVLTDGKKHDVKVAPDLFKDLEPDSIISMDRAYIDFNLLYSLNKRGVWFVTRTKKNIDYTVIGQHEVPKKKNILSDKTIVLTGPKTGDLYPKKLRMVEIFDTKRKKRITFLTNNFKFAASTIADIYKSRWQIEIFFKWIKQNLKIKSFLGTSKNAVLIQIWIAIIYYLILSYIKAQSRYPKSLHLLTQIVSTSLFERANLFDLLFLDLNSIHRLKPPDTPQLKLPLML